MSLNKSKGNMYDFITHTWNPIKGQCYHDCSYCYMKRFGKLNPVRLDDKEFKISLGTGNFIFVGSSCDIFAKNIPSEWIMDVLRFCGQSDNKYLFQTKNPQRFHDFEDMTVLFEKSVICTTIETNRWYPEIMANSPPTAYRTLGMSEIENIKKYVTIEPILDFDIYDMIYLIKKCKPIQVNIGADSGKNNLPEPTKEKVIELISELNKFTVVSRKKNLDRLGGQQ